jgi:hypothetical protein
MVADASAFRLTYTPQYVNAFAVQRQAQRYHYTAMQRYVWLLVLVVQLLMGIAVIVWGENISGVLPSTLPPLLVNLSPLILFVIGSIVLWRVVCGWLAPLVSARWLTERKAPRPLTFQASADRMSWESDDGGSWVKWAAVERVFVTPTAVCFLVGNSTPYVPRSAFEDAAALEQFIELALAHLTESARRASLGDRTVVAVRTAQAGA